MKTKKKKGRRRLRPGFVLFVLALFSFVMMISIASDLAAALGVRAQIQTSAMELERTDAQRSELENTRRNLTNPDYMEYAARGTYNVSRAGEQIIKFAPMEGE